MIVLSKASVWGAGTICAVRAGMPARFLEHRARLRQVHRHARLAEHVLAGLERRDGELLVHVGPSADANRVDAIVGQELGPIGGDLRDAEFVRHLLGRFGRAVGDGDELDAFLLPEAGDVP